MKCKCQFPQGIDIRPDGINKLDPCIYKRRQEHRNVTVFLDQCINCGHIEISWRANDNTQTVIHSEMDTVDKDLDGDLVFQRTIDPDDYDEDDDIEEDDEWVDNPD